MTTLNDSDNTRQQCARLMQQMSLPDSFSSVVNNIYLPLSAMLMNKINDQPLLVSINGAQGTGKSTLTAFIKLIIESEMDARVAVLSLDDFYHTREKSQLLFVPDRQIFVRFSYAF